MRAHGPGSHRVSINVRCLALQGQYGWTQFCVRLNELHDEERGLLPQTDTRFRPDMRCMELGDFTRECSIGCSPLGAAIGCRHWVRCRHGVRRPHTARAVPGSALRSDVREGPADLQAAGRGAGQEGRLGQGL